MTTEELIAALEKRAEGRLGQAQFCAAPQEKAALYAEVESFREAAARLREMDKALRAAREAHWFNNPAWLALRQAHVDDPTSDCRAVALTTCQCGYLQRQTTQFGREHQPASDTSVKGLEDADVAALRRAIRWFDEHTPIAAESLSCVLVNEAQKEQHLLTLKQTANVLERAKAALSGKGEQ